MRLAVLYPSYVLTHVKKDFSGLIAKLDSSSASGTADDSNVSGDEPVDEVMQSMEEYLLNYLKTNQNDIEVFVSM